MSDSTKCSVCGKEELVVDGESHVGMVVALRGEHIHPSVRDPAIARSAGPYLPDNVDTVIYWVCAECLLRALGVPVPKGG